MQRHQITYEQSNFRLDRNDCLCPSLLNKVLKKVKLVATDICNYTSPYSVVQNLAKAINCISDNIHINNGSEIVLKTLVETMDCNEWVTTTPTFELFVFYCKLYNKKITQIPFYYDTEFFLDLNLDTNTSHIGLYIVSPHNPTGYIFKHGDVLKLCTQYKYVVVDEAYINPISMVDLYNLPDNLIIVRTFSKMGLLTGMRLGFCISTNIALISKLNQYRPMYLNSITLKLADYILQNHDILYKVEEQFGKVRELLQLNIVATAGNFVLLDNTPEYRGYKLKEYKFNGRLFHRLTLFDLEIYNTL
jgi:histidinol-phosphate/aromatic aminotransferase/cobyric acid decarboxylase-like protein